ncbi:bifunctional 5,10-methylenetetrahydrofolate dehydrogenase/5,10-methenyltetrahydrofolate cyclohydrolase [Patescibacteria group bacterium]|nr:bifunctional 5,10-methylenetetrahydrofolate dehydrogenase/5,10-methenyltetrahydrofolate cyclohydrolase [Patescibacteria group bacterium]MBU1663032.1 bifunctional 5,10-methylenetetrahydrofolate dehydrogenase/5,10-methenyltetrahydrofolate cyclohydrolase [Patescibacteria group bacterium]MBU1934159.1 bifunctional 5,10-methylenetetrahydrofolate dehydrogenase/5,10-methenyltetrahydrofolate cyclohydrolase [Patescibacteria group bacterium]MBU2007556.1 bifunctional 5,10-methylenetetrahydrofolate dehydr
MSKIIDGRILAEKIKDQIVKEITSFNKNIHNITRPNLAIILIGERPDSKLYVRLKEIEAKKVGIDTHLYKCAEDISEQEILQMIKCLNEDKTIDAILVQLPLPVGIDTDTIIMALDPAKDVDGFQPDNLEKLLKSCDFSGLMPPVLAVVLEMLRSIDYEIKNKQVVIISNSDIFGRALAHVLKCQGAIIEVVKADNKKLAEHTSQADVLITAAGKPKFIKKDMIKKDAVIIDIGIFKLGDKVVGDVDFDDVKNKVSYITPVPGGVGPLTIAMAFKNTLEIYKKRHE